MRVFVFDLLAYGKQLEHLKVGNELRYPLARKHFEADVAVRTYAEHLQAWRDASERVAFVIGGPDGLDAGLKQAARWRMRLSSLTLPHALARILLAEQFYRAWSILAHHPYHRA